MIKVNLLPQRKARRQMPEGEKHIALGMGAIALLGAGVFLGLHRPKATKLSEINAENERIQSEIAEKRKNLAGFDELAKSNEAATARVESIKELNAAAIVPAHVLHEIGEILTKDHLPTMTQEMKDRVDAGQKGDPNRRFALDWDPHHVWITEFTDKGGEFKLIGGAQTDGDITQLALRLQASVYFKNVVPAGAERVTEQGTAATYFRFTITGKLVY